ncbi:uncharacterized protein LOC124268846 isoform X1 [Haliotis rubra]|uniref:uncharacterized protein LOC124268846 isoform X1 n=1 Tax=Haliotis rubra TaxID=36100 RepID=UPI001EE610BF|nr:uncharacterized protein LOC124268846 isoform X1 [Haliotis rubra]XP_046559823.1 uncharacterized protein LOC124268846 isoform X2 [Haliotis rubra]XP_046559824.1 uncharacterized protein LOC124268846 isoform X1 [Haliotis rubra]
MLPTERHALYLVVPANILYTLAAVTHSWFELPPHSFYGLWWVQFCDYLRCQIIPAFYSEEPVWYHVLQGLSLLGWGALSLSMLLLISTRLDKCLPEQFVKSKRQLTISGVCLVSVFAISSSLVVFYAKLDESSPAMHPQISWSAMLAGTACLFELLAGIMLMQVPTFTI